MDGKIKVIAVSGPTASGKSALALSLALALDAEIVCCDSMQIYRGMDIGTAKPTKEEQAAVRHHMVDILDPDDSFSAAEYAVLAEKAIEDIAARGKLSVVCGGTGLYLEALRSARHGSVMPTDPAFREEMRALAEREGNGSVHARLRAVDEESAALIHPNNLTRVIRALEIYRVTGKTKSLLDKEASKENPRLSLLNLTLTYHSRELLYKRIDERVDAMMREGLLRETETLLSLGFLKKNTTASAAIGYKECLGALSGEITAQEAANALKLATRHYAKRQITWFSAKEHTKIFADDGEKMRDGADILRDALSAVNEFLGEQRE